jgi:hypothetical protein
MDRARFYLGVLDAMIQGENVGEEYYSVAFLGLSNDNEARKAFEQSTGAQWPEARGMIQAFAADGHTDLATQVNNMLWVADSGVTSEPVFDMAITALATWGTGALVRGGTTASMYGVRAAFTGRAALANRTSAGAVTKGFTSKPGWPLRFRAAITGKTVPQVLDELTMNEVGLINPGRMAQHVSQLADSYSARFLYAALGTNTLTAAVNLPLTTIDMMVNPEAWAEGDARARSLELYGHTEQEIERIITAEQARTPQAGTGQRSLLEYEMFGGAPGAPANVDFTGMQLPTQDDGRPGWMNTVENAFNGASAPAMAMLDESGNVMYDETGGKIIIDMANIESEEDLAAAQAAVSKVAGNADNPMIGVPEGHIATTAAGNQQYDQNRNTNVGTFNAGEAFNAFGTVAPGGQYGTPNMPGGESPVAVPAQYRQSDINGVIFSMTPAQVESFQRTAVRAGLIDPEAPGFFWGSAGEATRGAMATTMGNSNRMGRDWRSMIEVMGDDYQRYQQEQEKENQPVKPLWVPTRAYTALDPETANQWTQEAIEKRLGRKANSWEMREMARYMEGNHREAYDNEQASAKSVWEARGRANEGLDPGAIASFEEVDENARAEGKFEEIHETELNEVDRWQNVKRDSQSLFASLDGISNQLGGV